MCSSSRHHRWPFALLLASSLLAGPVAAEDPRPIAFEVTVVHTSRGKGGVQANARARRVDRILGEKLKYDSLRVLDFKRKRVAMDQIGTVNLPNQKRFHFRPMDLSDEGVFVAVDVEKSFRGDFRIRSRKPVFVPAQRYQDGDLWIVLEPDY